MKLPLYLLSLLAGAFLGWQKTPDPVPEAAAEAKEEAPADEGNSAWRSWADRIGTADADELERLRVEMGEIENTGEPNDLIKLLGLRWLDLDPQAGFDFFRKNFPFDFQRWFLIEWARRDVEAVLTRIAGLGEESGHFRSEVGAALFSADPEVYWEYFKRCGDPDMFSDDPTSRALLKRHFREAAKVAEEAALRKIEEGTFRSFGQGGLAYYLTKEFAERDPQAGLAWVKSLPEALGNGAAKTFLIHWAQVDPVAASDQLEMLKDRFKDRQIDATTSVDGGLWDIEESIVREWVKRDAFGALDWVQRSPDGLSWGTYALGRAFSEAIASGTLRFEEVYPGLLARGFDGDIENETDILGRLGESLSSEQLATSLRWLGTAEPGVARDAATEGLARQWLRIDPVAFAAYVGENHPGGDFIEKAFSGYLDSHRDALSALPPDARAAGVAGALTGTQFAYVSGERGFDPTPFVEALEGAPVNAAYGEAAAELSRTWGITDPILAMDWVNRLPVSAERSGAVASVAESWAKYDAFGLSEYLTTTDVGTDRDTAIGSLVREIGGQEPDSAWRWSQSIGDARARGDARTQVIEAWRLVDPVRARQAVLGAENLAAAEREALLKIAETR